MSSDAHSDTAVARRLHWSSLFFGLGPMARSALPLLVLVAISRELGWQFWALLTLIPSAIGPFVRVLTMRYRLEPNELVIAEGLLSRRSRHVPYERIQHVELKQGVLQRVLGVADVKVESAGGSETPEARLTVLSLKDAEDLRAQIAARRGAAAVPVERADTTVLALGFGDIVLLGASEGRGWLVIGAALGVLWQFDDFIDVEWPMADLLTNRDAWRGMPVAGTFAASMAAIVAGALAIFLLFRLLSIGWAIVKLHGFTLTREGDVLRSRYGLLTRFAAAIPRHRVQLLTIVEPALLRWFGRASIKVETAGRFEADQAGVGAQWLAPVVGRERVAEIVSDVLPGLTPSELPWQPLAEGTAARLFRRTTLGVVALSGVACGAIGWWGLILLPPGIVFARFAARGWAQGYAFAVTDDVVAFRSGWWTRQTSIVRAPRIQVLAITEDLFDRRWGMASLRVDTAGATTKGHPVNVPFLDRALANDAFVSLRAAAARTDLQW